MVASGGLIGPTAPLLEPAAPVPMPSQIWFVLGYHQEVTLSEANSARAAGTFVALSGRVGLDERNYFYAKSAHTTAAAVIAVAPTTIRMSASPRRCGRKGLKPMAQC